MEQYSFCHWPRLKQKALDLTREKLAERVEYSAATFRKYKIGMVLAYWVEAEFEEAVEQAIAYALEQNDV